MSKIMYTLLFILSVLIIIGLFNNNYDNNSFDNKSIVDSLVRKNTTNPH